MIDEKKFIEFLDDIPFLQQHYNLYVLLLDWINQQPKVGEWIPCSERLPKKDDFPEQRNRILASCSDGIVRNATIESLLNSEKHISRGNEFTYIAWQPLPEPYKPEEASPATQTWADTVMRTFLGRDT